LKLLCRCTAEAVQCGWRSGTAGCAATAAASGTCCCCETDAKGSCKGCEATYLPLLLLLLLLTVWTVGGRDSVCVRCSAARALPANTAQPNATADRLAYARRTAFPLLLLLLLLLL
jgi:hypothetical protein